mgnify:CR=1 FL=1
MSIGDVVDGKPNVTSKYVRRRKGVVVNHVHLRLAHQEGNPLTIAREITDMHGSEGTLVGR